MRALSCPPVFVVGHPRSGTTWLTKLLGMHPRLGSVSETHLFNLYLHPFLTQRRKWLKDWVDDDRLDELLRDLVIGIFESALQRRGKVRVVEKTPTHRYWIPQIRSFFPDAKFVHCVRDGRDVALSLLERRRKTGQQWIPRTLTGCARSWRASIELMKRTRNELGGDVVLEVRYEDLLRHQTEELERVLSFTGEPVERSTTEVMVSRFPPRAPCGNWETKLNPIQKWRFRRVAGSTLRELGYRDR